MFLSTSTQSQHRYDFDSLLQHNPLFEPVLKAVADTFKLFENTSPLEFSVATDFKNLVKNKYQDTYQEAMVTYQIADTLAISRKVRVKPRGAFRLKECQYPPLRVNVKETKEVFELLDDLDKLKMVVPCKGFGNYQTYIYNEYLAYRLYNILTDHSFRVRLIKINYQNTGGKMEIGSAHTFIIENQKSLAARLDCIPLKVDNVGTRYTQKEYAILMYLFQFMIGNTDWSVPGLHNVKLIKSTSPLIPNPIPVPYDFDYSGLVDASYAAPHESLGIPSVRVRKYLGFCTTEEELKQAIDVFQRKRGEILKLIEEFPWLSDAGKIRSLKYIQNFYKIIDDPKKIKAHISLRCKK